MKKIIQLCLLSCEAQILCSDFNAKPGWKFCGTLAILRGSVHLDYSSLASSGTAMGRSTMKQALDSWHVD